jgi:hypothetical protein
MMGTRDAAKLAECSKLDPKAQTGGFADAAKFAVKTQWKQQAGSSWMPGTGRCSVPNPEIGDRSASALRSWRNPGGLERAALRAGALLDVRQALVDGDGPGAVAPEREIVAPPADGLVDTGPAKRFHYVTHRTAERAIRKILNRDSQFARPALDCRKFLVLEMDFDDWHGGILSLIR